jgi:hypothetical protein
MPEEHSDRAPPFSSETSSALAGGPHAPLSVGSAESGNLRPHRFCCRKASRDAWGSDRPSKRSAGRVLRNHPRETPSLAGDRSSGRGGEFRRAGQTRLLMRCAGTAGSSRGDAVGAAAVGALQAQEALLRRCRAFRSRAL